MSENKGGNEINWLEEDPTTGFQNVSVTCCLKLGWVVSKNLFE